MRRTKNSKTLFKISKPPCTKSFPNDRKKFSSMNRSNSNIKWSHNSSNSFCLSSSSSSNRNKLRQPSTPNSSHYHPRIISINSIRIVNRSNTHSAQILRMEPTPPSHETWIPIHCALRFSQHHHRHPDWCIHRIGLKIRRSLRTTTANPNLFLSSSNNSSKTSKWSFETQTICIVCPPISIWLEEPI